MTIFFDESRSIFLVMVGLISHVLAYISKLLFDTNYLITITTKSDQMFTKIRLQINVGIIANKPLDPLRTLFFVKALNYWYKKNLQILV